LVYIVYKFGASVYKFSTLCWLDIAVIALRI